MNLLVQSAVQRRKEQNSINFKGSENIFGESSVFDSTPQFGGFYDHVSSKHLPYNTTFEYMNS
jgi:hypothetical protein